MQLARIRSKTKRVFGTARTNHTHMSTLSSRNLCGVVRALYGMCICKPRAVTTWCSYSKPCFKPAARVMIVWFASCLCRMRAGCTLATSTRGNCCCNCCLTIDMVFMYIYILHTYIVIYAYIIYSFTHMYVYIYIYVYIHIPPCQENNLPGRDQAILRSGASNPRFTM